MQILESKKLSSFKVSCLALLLCGLYSCGDSGAAHDSLESAQISDEFQIYSIDIDRPDVRFADVLEEVELMQLEETEESLLSFVSQVSEMDDKFIFPGYNNGDVYAFSHTGKFLSKFNHIGGGEGEYSSIRSIWVQGDSIALYDEKKHMVHWYDHTGDHLKELRMPEGASHVYPFNEGYMLDMSFAPMSDSLDYKVWILDKNLKVKDLLVNYHERVSFPMATNANSFKHYNNKLIFNSVFGKTTYFIGPEGAQPFFEIDFGDKYLWNDKSLSQNIIAAMNAIPEGKGVWDHTPFVSYKKIFMTYDISLIKLMALIDRETGDYDLLDISKNSEERYGLIPIGWMEERLLFSIPSNDIGQLLGELEEGQLQFREGTTLEGIESSENPVLMWVKFK